ncbi:MAG TPA: SDR family oxidoreductase, partial [Anaerolineaceae bacterium]|nr:SDR family oxidoreductase [Anaerolineaceae bacterium]
MEATRTVLITGASGGIGRATVQVFAGHGWRVIGVDRKEFGPDFPENGLFIQSSIVHPENLESIYDRAKAFTGTLNTPRMRTTVFPSACLFATATPQKPPMRTG